MAVIVGALTIVGAPIMKCFAWRIPLVVHAIVFFLAAYAVYFVWALILAVGVLFKVYPTPNTGLYALIGMCPAAGWLITRMLAKTYGTPTRFPAIGARVMTVLVPIVATIVVVVVRFLGI
jgi:hypothetical protein